MKCIKCGYEMRDDDKCCYNCGCINPNVQENIKFLKRNHINPKKIGAKSNNWSIAQILLTMILILIFIGIIIALVYYIFLK